jgi:FlaA1/EpsC-like NDP-sugar epimerase
MSFAEVPQPTSSASAKYFSAFFSSAEIRRALRQASRVTKSSAFFIAALQGLLVFCALTLAWLLRFNFFLPYRPLLFSAAPVLIAIRLVAIARFGLLRGWWRYTDIDDGVSIVKAIAAGSVVFVITMRFVLGVVAFPRAIYFLEPLLSTFLLAGIRLLSRVSVESVRIDAVPPRKVILIGAGTAAQMTIREFKRPGSGYCAVACVDDDRSKTGIKIHGVPVVGTVDELPAYAARYDLHEAVIAVRSATEIQMRRFADICLRADIKAKRLPSLHDMINGIGEAGSLRDVRLEDLLSRDPVEIDLEAVRSRIEGQVVMVTGAAGSIGSELCRQISMVRPGKLICLDHNETGIFYLQHELTERNGDSQFVFCVSDVGDRARMKSLLEEHRPRIIFHAAAYKHVPMMESNVYEAIKNNVFALANLLDVAEENGCPSFVLISSDKAVNPTNVMGATKRLGELIISCRPAGPMRCVSVRFGNVLGSNGSVVPLFQKQIRDNRELTITHPDITRFFMTIGEAASLVLQAFAIGEHGETLLLEMGKPVHILDLARTLLHLSGKSEQEVGIRFIGLRDGEKLFEELSYPWEKIGPTACPKIKRIQGAPQRGGDLKQKLRLLWNTMACGDAATIRTVLKHIVPEYSTGTEESTEENCLLAVSKVSVASIDPRANKVQ